MQQFRPFLIIIAIGLLLMGASRWNLTQPFRNLAGLLTEPILAAETQAVRGPLHWITLLRTIKDLYKENNQLRVKVAELEAETARLKEVDHDNKVLREELRLGEERNDELLPAQVIGRTASGVIKDLIINRGSSDGIGVGWPIIAQGHLIGTISTVQARQATVVLITHPRSLIPALLQESRTTGLLKGGISGLKVTDILIDAPVKQGEAVLTSGLGGLLPPDIPIGKVVESTARPGDITKQATLVLPVDISKLETVFVRKVSQ